MNELVFIQNDQPITTSLKIAEVFEKRHDHILEKIEILKTELTTPENMGVLNENYNPQFFKSNYQNSQGKSQPMYLLNRDAFMEVVGNLNGAKARQFKRKYFATFNEMEKKLQEFNDPLRIATRYQGKLTRLKETDIIKQLVAYAKIQGSKHADKLYVVYTNLANKIVGLKGGERDNATIKQLNTLDDVESMIFHIIKRGMAQCKHYKEIYQDCKIRLNAFLEITFGEQRLIA